MRWNAGLAAVALIAGLAGCRQQTYMTEADVNQFRTPPYLIPPNLESSPHDAILPATSNMPVPMTVNDTNRTPRPIRLAECIATALEQGNIGSQSALFPGIANDTLVQFSGRTVGGDDAVRVLAYDPAIVASDIESSLARFDARWLSTVTWSKQDQAVNTILTNFSNGDSASFSTGLFKPLPSGGLAGITVNNDYQLLSQAPSTGVTNPSWRPQIQFLFEQPLLQFFGVEINQLSSQLPGSVLVPGLRPSGGTRTEGILITRLRFDQQRTEFERNVNFMLYNVEVAYWNLYASYYTLYSREQGLRMALVSWQLTRQKFEAGVRGVTLAELEQVRAQYEDFRAQRFQALDKVLDNERQLRGLMGLPLEDGTRLLPADSPTLGEFTPDWGVAVNEALALRPELILARQDLKFRQLDLINQKNLLKPDLRAFATYNVNGLGTRLDGGPTRFSGTSVDPNTGAVVPNIQPGNALSSLADNAFQSWQLGLRLDMPLGFRDANAAVRSAHLNLERSYTQLKDQEMKAIRLLGFQYRQLSTSYETIGAQRSSRLATAKQLEVLFDRFVAGLETPLVFLDAQRNLANALASEYTAIANYNNALAGYHFAKGTILAYDNANIAEGPLPAAAQVRAVEHFREKSVALKLRERADPAVYEAARRNQCYVPDNVAAMPMIAGKVPSTDPRLPAADLPPPTLPGETPLTAPLPMPATPPPAPGTVRLPEGR
jgi:outer membrane protein TolC